MSTAADLLLPSLSEPPAPAGRSPHGDTERTRTGHAFLATARSIGVRLCRDAFWDGERCNWMGDSMEFVDRDWRVVRRSFGPDLYSGTAGIALFLAALNNAAPERPIRTTAEGALAQALSRLDDIPAGSHSSFHSGLLGIGWATLHCGEWLAREDLVERGLAIMTEAAAADPATQELDVIAGSAGAVPALLMEAARYADRPTPSALLRDAAVRHGERLLATAVRGPRGWSWDTLHGDGATHHLCGYAHGASGVAHALLELYAATGEPRWLEAAHEALRYERSWFSTEQGNWPDLREFAAGSGGEPSYTAAWCHGAPGIGLARVRGWEITGDATMRAEAETAVATTTQFLDMALHGRIGDCSLCHGFLGNAELLLTAAEGLHAGEHRAAAERYATAAMARLGRDGFPWPCGVPGGGESPTLMLGLAGIGYFYLRLVDAAAYPSPELLRGTISSTTIGS